MGILKAIVSAISSDLTQGLAARGKYPLTDGAIVLGSAGNSEQSAPPRIVFEPISGTFGDADFSQANDAGGADIRAALLARPLATEMITFLVHVWGIANPTPGSAQVTADDVDETDDLKRQVVRSCLQVAPGIAMFGNSDFLNSRSGKAFRVISGWYVSFTVTIPTTIQDYPLSWANESNNGLPIGAQIETSILSQTGGDPEAGPTITVPLE